MSNYKIAEYPQDKYRFKLYDNVDKLDYPKIIARHLGCVGAINTAYFALIAISSDSVKAYDHQSALMIDGIWKCPAIYHEYGICIDASGKMTLGTEQDATHDYAAALPPAVIDGKDYNCKFWSKNGVSYSGLKADGTAVLMLSSKDFGMDSKQAVAAMRDAGCVHVFRWDGSWSARGRIGGVDIVPSQYRCDRTWLLIFKRETGQPDLPEPEKEPIMETIKITKKYMTKNRCFTNNRTYAKKKGMLHSTGTPGATAANIIANWDSNTADAAVEFVIDDTGIYQTLPLGIESWHGGGSSNRTHVACEICEPAECVFIPINWRTLSYGGKYNGTYAVKRLQQELAALGFNPNGVDGSFGPGCDAAVKAYQKSVGLTADGSVGTTTLKYLQKREGSYLRYNVALAAGYFSKVYGHAVALFAWLMGEIGGKADEIICHSEGYKAGIASNHADVMHWFPSHGESMDSFRLAVKAALTPTAEPTPPTDSQWYSADQAWVKENGISDGTRPEENVTRAEIWAMLHRTAGMM